jgi:hypothetical protein
MAFKSINRRGATALLAATTVIALAPSAAVATWRIHNDVDITQITAPPGGTENETCSNALHGQSAWSTSVSPGEDPELSRPAAGSFAYQPVDYVVWKAPPGASGGDFVEADVGTGVNYQLADGTLLPAIFVRQFTTPARASVPAQLVFPPASSTSDNLYLYSLTNFTATLPSSGSQRVVTGDIIGVKPASGGSTFIDLTVISCGPVPVRIDVRPGSSTNNVNPRQSTPLLPVLVYGSSTIDVRTIAAVHLQNASPKAVAANLRRPFDADGDGFLDRRYYFAPSATGIRCGQATVALTGRTTSGVHFKSTDAIHTVC